jgi:redox-sensitive bicupin YhaK (pirin superfamily)
MKALINQALLASALLFTAALPLAPQESVRVPQFENDNVRVWRTNVMPNAPLTLHRHDHPRVIIPLAGGTITIRQQSGASETHRWETGKAYWLGVDPPGQLHVDIDAGPKPIEVMVVELKSGK